MLPALPIPPPKPDDIRRSIPGRPFVDTTPYAVLPSRVVVTDAMSEIEEGEWSYGGCEEDDEAWTRGGFVGDAGVS